MLPEDRRHAPWCDCGWRANKGSNATGFVIFFLVLTAMSGGFLYWLQKPTLPDDSNQTPQSEASADKSSKQSAGQLYAVRATSSLSTARATSSIKATASLQPNLVKTPGTPSTASAPNLDEARALVQAGKFKEAAEAYKKLTEAFPKLFDAHFELGLLCMDLKDYPCALTELSKAAELEPSHAGALENLAAVLQDVGQTAPAVATYRRLLKLDPSKGDALLELSRILDAAGSLDEAEVGYRSFLQRFPDHPQAAAVKARFDEMTRPEDDIAVPIRRSGSAILVKGQVENAINVDFLIDTGASLTIISTELAEEIGFDLDAPGYQYLSLNTANGAIEAPKIVLESVALGKAVAYNVPAVVYDIDASDPIDGLLGLSFLDQFRFTIDSQNGVMHLQEK